MAEKEVPTLKKAPLMGVWVDGQLRLKSRDRLKIDQAAESWMKDRRNVWVAPVGSFVTV